ncbi:MAG: ATP-binding protein [Betaproteobacteria bacterium]|nr:ATP-binding protein [Betaproteobacteria bacterium]
MIRRTHLLAAVQAALDRSRVVALLGPRQCGKTTLAREFVADDTPNYFDLENPLHLQRLDQPMAALEPLRGLVVIDEVQRRPELFPVLRVLVDRVPLPARFLVLGSASPGLLRQSSESLAGRISRVLMSGFSQSAAWRRDFVQTFVERDIPQLGFGIAATTLMRFWSMAAHYHGQIWNAAELARSLGVGESSARRYLDLLTDAFMVRQVEPWHANLKKRQVRSPKVVFRDTGLLHRLLGIRTQAELFNHPKCGASWEGYAIEEIIKEAAPDEAYFWATHQGAEIDLLLRKDGRMFGVECKRVDAPAMTPSIRIAMEDLGLERIAVVYPGSQRYVIADGVEAVPIRAICEGMEGLFPAG